MSKLAIAAKQEAVKDASSAAKAVIKKQAVRKIASKNRD